MINKSQPPPASPLVSPPLVLLFSRLLPDLDASDLLLLPSGDKEDDNNYDKVNRCLARYSPRATTTSQPINRAPNEPAMVRNAKFGPNLVVSGQKILFLLEKSKVLLLT